MINKTGLNKTGLKNTLFFLGFGVVEQTQSVIVAFRKTYQAGGGELWTGDYELIIRPEAFGFKMKPKGGNKIVFEPI